MVKKYILAVDDEINIVELIKMNLEQGGFNVIPCYTGLDAINIATEQLPDLILLDLMLPDIDGFEVFRKIRLNEETKHIPIIMVTAKSEETDKVIGLGLGADDYITKPFGVRELEARVRSALRKSAAQNPEQNELKDSIHLLYVKDITIDDKRHTVSKGGESINLTLSEFRIFKTLVENKGYVLSRENLLSVISSDRDNPDIRIVDVHIRNIRKKIGDDYTSNQYIETIRGVGYKID